MIRATNWTLIWLACTAPLPVALAVAWLFWRPRQIVIGNVVGVGLLLVASLIFGGSEYAAGLEFRVRCELAETPCAPTGTDDFQRIALFGFIAMAQAMILFILSGLYERRAERSHYDGLHSLHALQASF